MVCSQCGYVMGPFDKVCSRCNQVVGAEKKTVLAQPEQTINLMPCPACQQMVSSQAIACPKCGQPISKMPFQATSFGRVDVSTGNGSGTGATAVVPDEVKGFSWGAFLLGWIWAIAHNTWIGLLCLVPYVGFIMFIILGVKGNEWAWQNRRWESVEHFKQVEAIWTRSGIITFCVFTAFSVVYLIVFLVTIPGFQSHP